MKNYEIRYISAPDDIMIKVFNTQAESSNLARQQCADERDVYAITSTVEFDDNTKWDDK